MNLSFKTAVKSRLSYFFSLTLLLFLVILFSCGRSKPRLPVEFNLGEHQCDYCRMGIADIRFRAQAVTTKGKRYYFDSIECLGAWSRSNQEKIDTSWVGDFLQEGKWVEEEKAIFLHSENLNSPMGAGLSAYENETLFIEAQKEYGGSRLNRSELYDYIENLGK